MDLDDLRAFTETVRRGSLSEAAVALSLSQPTVSRRVRRLESELGQPLLERSRPAVAPTRAGLRLMTVADRLLREWEALRQDGGQDGGQRVSQDSDRGSVQDGGQDGTQGRGHIATLHVAASTTPGEALAPDLLARFARLHPAVRPHLHVMNSASVEACVGGRHCDVGFLGWPPHGRRLRAIPVAEDEVVLACPPGHPFAVRGAIALADLAGQSLVLREPGSGTRRAVEAALAASGLALPPHRVVEEVDGSRALLAAVAAGRGLGFVSARLAGPAAVRIADLPVRRFLLLVHHARHLPPPARAFVDFVLASAAPAQSPAQSPAPAQAQVPAQSPAHAPAQSPAQSPADAPAHAPAQSPAQSPADGL